MEHASIDYQLNAASAGIEEQRRDYFRRTIERAFAKAQARQTPLMCYVGGEHAKLTVSGPGDTSVTFNEARYFNQQYGSSKGHVGSILVERIGKLRPGAMELAVLPLMGNQDRIFIDLRHKSWTTVLNRPIQFFAAKEPKYDGVLFLK